jgi:hypothetical protein
MKLFVSALLLAAASAALGQNQTAGMQPDQSAGTARMEGMV